MKKGDYIVWLSKLSAKDTNIAGGKGANLGEMYNLKFPVPPAFVITVHAFDYFIEKSHLDEQIRHILHSINPDNVDELNAKTKEIRDLIKSAKMPEDLQNEIIEAYDDLNVDLGAMRDSPNALSIMKSSRDAIFVSVRSSATSEDGSAASFAGQQESFINVKGNPQLIESVKKVFASIFTARSVYYRIKKGFDKMTPIAAVVQKMINSDKSGVIFSKNPIKNDGNIVIESVFGQGEGIVSGKIKPDLQTVSPQLEVLSEKIADKKIAIIRDAGGLTKTVQLKDEISKKRVLKVYEIKQLAEYALKLESHYKKPQDIEFAIEGENIFILQTRPITTLGHDKKEEELEGNVLTHGLGASPGIASGPVKLVYAMEDLDKVKKGDVLVTTMTNPDMVVTMQKAAAIITNEGGVTSHAAIVSREMGIPAVVGTENATSILTDGEMVTVDGFNGKIFAGKAANKSVEILPIVETKTKIKAIVDLPEYAERAAKTDAYGVGLMRLEGIIASSKKHPMYYVKTNTLPEYTKLLEHGIQKISECFIGKEIWIRTSDIRSDEYSNLEGAPKEIERNPMLGDHGIRFSLKHKDLFKAELQAIKNLATKGHKFGVMFPQIISPNEVKQAKDIMDEMQMLNHSHIKFGIMVETPAAAILIKDICDVGIDFISFGTNDLTQFTLAIDRGNENVQDLYDETSWAIKKQISRVIRECHAHEPRVETSICGQAGSEKDMVEFLVKAGIDSISVNADVAKEISEFVRDLESKHHNSEDKSKTENHEHKTEHNEHKTEHHENKEKHHEKNFLEKVEEKIFDVFSGA